MNYIPLYVILPLIAALLIAIFGRRAGFIGPLLINLVLLFLFCLTLIFIIKGTNLPVYKVGGWGLVNGIPIGVLLTIDGLSKLFLIVINFIGLCAGVYSVSYMKKFTAEDKYYSLFSLMVTGMNGLVISGDIFNMFIFLEIATLASYALVAFGIKKEELEASMKYQILGGISSIIIFLGIVVIYWAYGTLNLADIGSLIQQGKHVKAMLFVQALFIMGFGLKAALVPFHSWLPDAHSSAPSPISAMLSGVLIKTVGVYSIMRLFFNLFPITYSTALIITAIGALSIVIGVLLAIGQWDIKRLLGYSSISQMGYVITGIGAGLMIMSKNGDMSIAGMAILGGIFHLFNHSIFKSLLFLTAGSIEYRTEERDMRNIGGLSERMPVTSLASLTASMSISGIPPFNGFFSKLIIILALIKAKYYGLSVIAVLAGIITLALFLKLQRYTYFEKIKADWAKIKESPVWMCVSMIILALSCLLTSALIIPGISEKFLGPAVDVLIKAGEYSKIILGQ